jgi:hypothetical protein
MQHKENTEMEKGCNYRQQLRSFDCLLAVAAVELEMLECRYISECLEVFKHQPLKDGGMSCLGEAPV